MKHPNQAIVETGGVGYDMTITVPTFSDLPSVGSEVSLHIHTHVREDLIGLYGFLRPGEKQLFEKLLTVSGIGPKLAITILSGMPADEMVGSIRETTLPVSRSSPALEGKRQSAWCLSYVTSRPRKPAAGTDHSSDECGRGRRVSACRIWGISGPQRRKLVTSAVKAGKAGSFDMLFREVLSGLSK